MRVTKLLPLCLGLALAAPAAVAQVGIGKLGTCQIYATCPDPFADTCGDANAPLRLFSARIRVADAAPGPILWVETDYSRFPQSDVNEEIGFLPVTFLPKEGWEAKITALIDGSEKVAGTTGLLWARLNGEPRDGIAFDLYQFNAKGAVRRTKFACPPGEM